MATPTAGVNFTGPERALRLCLQVYAVLFGIAGVLYLLLPHTTFAIANAWSATLTPSLPPVPAQTERFWLVLGFAGMMTIAALCAVVQRDVRRYRPFVPVLFVSKLASTVGYAVLFAVDLHLIHALGGLTDLVLFAVAAALYHRAGRS